MKVASDVAGRARNTSIVDPCPTVSSVPERHAPEMQTEIGSWCMYDLQKRRGFICNLEYRTDKPQLTMTRRPARRVGSTPIVIDIMIVGLSLSFNARDQLPPLLAASQSPEDDTSGSVLLVGG
jgi:hypothetical protein